MATQYPIVVREDELNAQEDTQRFMLIASSISRKLERAERMMDDLQNPLKAAALFAHYCAALEQMPVTQSEFKSFCINPQTQRPYFSSANTRVFPDYFGPMIESLGSRLDNIYVKGILPIFHQAQWEEAA
jgi:hypothetical protein